MYKHRFSSAYSIGCKTLVLVTTYYIVSGIPQYKRAFICKLLQEFSIGQRLTINYWNITNSWVNKYIIHVCLPAKKRDKRKKKVDICWSNWLLFHLLLEKEGKWFKNTIDSILDEHRLSRDNSHNYIIVTTIL